MKQLIDTTINDMSHVIRLYARDLITAEELTARSNDLIAGLIREIEKQDAIADLLESVKTILLQYEENNGGICGVALQDARDAIQRYEQY